MPQFAPSSRLATRAQRQFRCNAGFHHGLIGPEGYGALDENSVHYVAIRVKPENVETTVKRVSDALGLEFEYLGGETSGIRMALAMEARIEIVTTVSGNVDTTATDAAAYPAVMAARDMATKGEGAYLSVFGVKDIDAAVARTEEAGVRTMARYEVDRNLTLVGVLLHGSWIRGDATPTSDVDVIVVVESRVHLNRALYRTWDQQPVT